MDKNYADEYNSLFGDIGVGAKIPFSDSIALKLEAIYMLKHNNSRNDSNLAILAGLNIAFGEKAQKVPVAEAVLVAAVPFSDRDDDGDGILNYDDKCPTTKSGRSVNKDGCFIDGDDDKDGVLNSMDKCPNTPKTVTAVDSEGCIKEINLHITFENASSSVSEASKRNITKFANFLKSFPIYTAEIVGHTDSVGSESANQVLSQKRADVVRSLIVNEGIENARVTSKGLGENSPVASNDDSNGRAQNRRIEAVLNKN